MDALDQAARLEHAERESAVAEARRRQAARPVNERGICAECGEDIDPRRLVADPTAARCIICQLDEERRARHRRRR